MGAEVNFYVFYVKEEVLLGFSASRSVSRRSIGLDWKNNSVGLGNDLLWI